MKLFAWKLARNILLTIDKLRSYGMNIIGDCPFCNIDYETINHIFVIVIWPIMFSLPLLVIDLLLIITLILLIG